MPFVNVESRLRATSPSGIFHAELLAFGLVDFRAKEAAKKAVPRIQRRWGLD